MVNPGSAFFFYTSVMVARSDLKRSQRDRRYVRGSERSMKVKIFSKLFICKLKENLKKSFESC